MHYALRITHYALRITFHVLVVRAVDVAAAGDGRVVDHRRGRVGVDRGFATGRGEEIEETILRLD